MDYAYAVKTLPQPDDPAFQDPAAAAPPELEPPQPDDARPWAGDVYDEGDETDPTLAYAAFSGQSGEQAWLDKAEDGTLTGWVRDETGQVWRYSDPDAWAIDVDDAGMAQTGGGAAAGAEAEQQPTGEAPDPSTAPPGEGLPLDFGTADEVVPEGGTESADTEAVEADPTDEEELPAEEDEEDEDDSKAKGGKAKVGKPWS